MKEGGIGLQQRKSLDEYRMEERTRQIIDDGRVSRADGYVNLLSRYGSQQDTSVHTHFEPEQLPSDTQLAIHYEYNGLFARIIDAPAEEAVKKGFDLGLDGTADQLVRDTLDFLDWEELASTAIKWARLFGGCIVVMLIDDGRGLDEPVDWENVQSIEELIPFDRSVVTPEYLDDGGYFFTDRTQRHGECEYYTVASEKGCFRVHESRCLVFKNGCLPERTTQSEYKYWGIPEYIRIHQALQDAVVSHGSAIKMLEKSVQPIYKMQRMSEMLASEEGESQILRRLTLIDMARGLLNSIAIDSEGEDYTFQQFQLSGVKDIVDSACNMLSALTNIPQTILFGRAPAGENATGEGDMENWYSYVERVQKIMLKKNLNRLVRIVLLAEVNRGKLKEMPQYRLTFHPLWSLSELEQATLEQNRAAAGLSRAQTFQTYVDMQALDPSEVRRKLAAEDVFDSVPGGLEPDAENGFVQPDMDLFGADAEKDENRRTGQEQMPAGDVLTTIGINLPDNIKSLFQMDIDGKTKSGSWSDEPEPKP